MDKQKQIEEMQKILEYCCNEYDEKGRHIRNKCNSWDCEYYDETNGVCASYSLKEARALYNAGYRKIPENAVVVSKQVWEEHIENWDATTKAVEERVRKETAEKVIEEIDKELYETSRMYLKAVVKDNKDCDSMDKYGVMTIAHDIVMRVAKQFGIEMEG